MIGILLEHRNGARWDLTGTAPDCEFPGQIVPPGDGKLDVTEQSLTPMTPTHLRAEVTTRLFTSEFSPVKYVD